MPSDGAWARSCRAHATAALRSGTAWGSEAGERRVRLRDEVRGGLVGGGALERDLLVGRAELGHELLRPVRPDVDAGAAVEQFAVERDPGLDRIRDLGARRLLVEDLPDGRQSGLRLQRGGPLR